MSREK